MDEKSRTPDDLLGDLLTGKKPAPKAIEKPQEQPIKEVEQKTPEKAPEKLQETPESQKSKATYYLDDNILEMLDEAWLELRKMATNRSQISKSWIVEQSVQMTIQELRDKGSKSKIAKKIPKE